MSQFQLLWRTVKISDIKYYSDWAKTRKNHVCMQTDRYIYLKLTFLEALSHFNESFIAFKMSRAVPRSTIAFIRAPFRILKLSNVHFVYLNDSCLLLISCLLSTMGSVKKPWGEPSCTWRLLVSQTGIINKYKNKIKYIIIGINICANLVTSFARDLSGRGCRQRRGGGEKQRQ